MYWLISADVVSVSTAGVYWAAAGSVMVLSIVPVLDIRVLFSYSKITGKTP